MGDEGTNVNPNLPFKVVQIFREGLPLPLFVVDVVVQYPAQILHKDLYRLAPRWHRGDGRTTVANDHRGHTKIHHRISMGIENEKEVHVGVRVDEPR